MVSEVILGIAFALASSISFAGTNAIVSKPLLKSKPLFVNYISIVVGPDRLNIESTDVALIATSTSTEISRVFLTVKSTDLAATGPRGADASTMKMSAICTSPGGVVRIHDIGEHHRGCENSA